MRIVVYCKWVFKLKYKSNGSIEHCKAWLVAKGYSQKVNIDFTKTYSLVVKSDSIQSIFAIVNYSQNAFLNGDLAKQIYMIQLEGYVQLGEEALICRLKNSLYSLKQVAM